MKLHFRAICATSLALILLSACGQKGKLILPVKTPPISAPYPTSVPKDEDTKDTDDTTTATKPAPV